MITRGPRWRTRAFAVGLWGWAAATAGAGEVPPDNWPEMRDQTFSAVWETVNESYFDPTFGGVDWAAMREKYRAKLPVVNDRDALRVLLQAMLGELRRTHFAIMPREAAVFTPAERTRIGTTGAEVALVEGLVAVSGVRADSPAARAGLRLGDTVLRVDNLEMAQLAGYLERGGLAPARRGFSLTQLVNDRLQCAVGAKVTLAVRGTDGAERKVEVASVANEGPWSEPMGDFPSMPVEWTARCDTSGLAYLHFNLFARPAMKPIRNLLQSIPAEGGLVLDLRGNPGGATVMAPGISGWLSDREFLLGTMHLREGQIGFTVTPQAGAFLGPVAVLIDCSSASTSEIMAAGLQEAGRARVFGENSPGAALPSLFKVLPTGDLLQYAVADMETPRGMLIEGRGVQPDETVRRTVADLAAGRDPVLAAAEKWLNATRHQATPSAGPP